MKKLSRPTNLFLFVACVTLSVACKNDINENAQSVGRPNFLIIVADDLGFSDLGCYGGEIETKNIDQLAEDGTLFTRFRTAPMCAPSRATLLTGQDFHLAGWGRQKDTPGTFYQNKWGYENALSSRVTSFPKVLQKAGYFTCIAGKWHLGKTAYSDPVRQGFDRSWVMLDGAANHWNDTGLGVGIFEKEIAEYSADGEPVDYPNGTFSTTHYTDKVISFLSERDRSKPFLAIASYTAPHWPLQPPPEYSDKYSGYYDNGYDQLREKRFEALKKKNIIPKRWELPLGLNHIPAWTSLDNEAQKRASRKMELYSAMLDHLDDDIGRLVSHIKKTGDYENTIIIFLSDNGADYLDFYHLEAGDFIRATYDNRYENMGSPTSFVSYGSPWAQAAMAPYSWYKGHLAEGGVSSPLIIGGGYLKPEKTMIHRDIFIRDLAPSILDWSGIESVQLTKNTITNSIFSGKSFTNFMENRIEHHSELNQPVVMDFQGQAAVWKDDWKLYNRVHPLDDNHFHLYSVAEDPGEKVILDKLHPELRDSLLALWHAYREEQRIVYPPQPQ